jgi:hypothetical protein
VAKAPGPLEVDIQAAFRKRLYYVAPRVRAVAIPNGGKRTPWEARQAKKEGLAAGFPDLMCMAPGPMIAFIEFKSPHGKLSENQNEWIERLDRMGFPVTVARSVDEGIAFLRAQGFPILQNEGLNSARNAAQPRTPNEGTV